MKKLIFILFALIIALISIWVYDSANAGQSPTLRAFVIGNSESAKTAKRVSLQSKSFSVIAEKDKKTKKTSVRYQKSIKGIKKK